MMFKPITTRSPADFHGAARKLSANRVLSIIYHLYMFSNFTFKAFFNRPPFTFFLYLVDTYMVHMCVFNVTVSQ